jgi:translation initiation factor eIF-2B subunit epsilon
MFTTMLGLCLTASTSIKPEYRQLYSDTAPDTASKEGRLELLRKVNLQLKTWKDLLHRFLKSNDDQVELLLTLEEYCADEGDFSGEQGALFAALFPQVRPPSRAKCKVDWQRCSAVECCAYLHPTSHVTSTRCICVQVVKLCYDHDLLSEEAILDWAHEKEHAGSEDRRFVNMCADLLAWLEDAEEESSDGSE